MIEKLHAILREIAARRQRQRLHSGLALTWWLGIFLAWLLWTSSVPTKDFLPQLVTTLLVASVGAFVWSRRGLGDPRKIAKFIEAKHPELRTVLLAALDQKPDDGAPLTYLQSRVVVESLASAERDDWVELVPRPRLTGLRFLHACGLGLFVLVACIALIPSPSMSELRPVVESVNVSVIDFEVDPGDIEIERGSPLTIQARFGTGAPADAILEITEDMDVVRTLPLARPFSDPVYQARLAAVGGPMNYRIVTSAGASRSYSVRVFDLPELKSSQAVLTFSEHHGKPRETIKDPGVIQVPELTRLELSLVANLPDLKAFLIASSKEPLDLTKDPADSSRHLISMVLTESVRYEIVLTDSAGRRNSRKNLLEIKVIPNKAPVVEVVLPRKNEKVTPIQEIRLEAKIQDDTNLLAQGLRYTIDGIDWQEIGTSLAGNAGLPPLSQLIDLEAAGVKPKDIVMWNAWAEDIGPDGRKRRVNGDIHLVRVRDFDEEFYQQAAPPGRAPSGGGEGAELIKTQTQILNATWSLRRDYAEISESAPPAKDLETLHRSQEIAMETAAALEAEQNDPAIRQFLTEARLAMKDALADLANAREQTSAGPLESAIGHEQTALRHLYQLMGSRTMILTGGGEGSESSSEDIPKNELDLKPMETPYQAETQAKPEKPGGEASEAMEILKRLDELAKRQRDLNEEIQALQTAAHDADTPEKKAEADRVLKQLREQQRELLADVDALREKTNEPGKQTTAERQKETLGEIREKARQASEQLGENKLGEALAAGRRAQESLEELHDDFRETSAAQLAGRLRELRQDARALEERQRQLADSARDAGQPRAPRLNDTAASSPEIAEQREALQELLEEMRRTAESAERAEPLVAQDLAEALRHADQNRLAQALDQMQQTGRNSAAAGRANEGISNLTREIEGAAERILGNEAQALRYARDELQRLAEQASGGARNEGKAAPAPGEGGEPGKAAGEGENGAQAGNQAGEGEEAGQAQGDGQVGDQSGQGNVPGQTAGGPGQDRQGQGSEAEAHGESGQGNGQTQASSPPPGQGSGGGSDRRGGNRNSPITGDGFEEWSDRLYDLESIVEDPAAQSAVARARLASRDMRRDFKRHSVEPGQEDLDNEVVRPLVEAAGKLDARLRELDRKDPLAPVGRDPVPDHYQEIVRRYFEELGK